MADKAPDYYLMTLTRPIEAHGETLGELQVRDPGIGGLEGIQASFGPQGMTLDLGSMPRLIAEGAGIPLSAAKKIRLTDLGHHLMPLMAFFGAAIPPTGPNS